MRVKLTEEGLANEACREVSIEMLGREEKMLCKQASHIELREAIMGRACQVPAFFMQNQLHIDVVAVRTKTLQETHCSQSSK